MNESEELIEGLILAEAQKSKRLTEIPEILAKAKVKLSNLHELKAPLAGASSETILNYELALASREALQAKIDELKTELELYSTQSELVISQKQLAYQQLDKEKSIVKVWRKLLTEKTSEVTNLAQENAEKWVTTYQNVPALAKIAEQVAELTNLRATINQESALSKAYQEKIISQRALILRQRTNALKRIRLLEKSKLPIDAKTGRLLRNQRAQIPTQHELRSELKQHIQESTEAQITQLEIQEELRKTPIDTSAHATEIHKNLTNKEITHQAIEELLKQHRSALLSLDQDIAAYIAILKVSNEETRLAAEEAKSYSLFLDERLLWIPSAQAISTKDPAKEVESIKNLTSKTRLNNWMQSFISDLSSHPLIWVLASGIMILLTFRRNRYKQVLIETATITEKKSCLKITPTFKAVWVTFLLALPLPLLFGLVAWRIDQPSEYSKAFRDCAFFLMVFGALRILFKPQGLLVSHFSFNKKIALHVTKQLNWFYYTIPLFILSTTSLLSSALFPQSGRLFFIAMLMVIITFMHLLLQPSKGLFNRYSDKWAKLIYIIGVGVPIIFIIGLSLGYITSVQTVRIQFITTLITTLITLFIGRLLLRWILVSRRRLAKDQAIKKYKATLAAKEKEKVSAEDLPTIEEIEANALNIVSVEEQTTRLVRVGVYVFIALAFWNIWSPSLPALKALDSIRFGEKRTSEVAPLQQNLPGITNPLSNPTTEKAPESPKATSLLTIEEEDSRLSLQDILTAIFIIILTIIAARNIPGLLELSVLSRLDFKPGGNYAVTTVLKYFIIVVGCLIAFEKIGVTWSSVQWLAAAVTLGIGFGLQEIFANFVAGIILLFERPLRLGDIVTVGDVSGKVTQIKIRATTILQFNNRELVVPNKEFITGQLINWTLSDNVLRFEFIVGVAYGTNTKKVTDTLLDIMSKHPDILPNEKKEVLFTNFGASTLDFLVRGYVARPEKLIAVPSDLHYEIDKRFREEGIEIAFPQTDIHIKSLPENKGNLPFIEED